MAKVQLWRIGLGSALILTMGAICPETLDILKKEAVRPVPLQLVPRDKTHGKPAARLAPTVLLATEEAAGKGEPKTPLKVLAAEQQMKAALEQLSRALDDRLRDAAPEQRPFKLVEARVTAETLLPEPDTSGCAPTASEACILAEAPTPQEHTDGSEQAKLPEVAPAEATVTQAAVIESVLSAVQVLAAVSQPPPADETGKPEKDGQKAEAADANEPAPEPPAKDAESPAPPPARTTPPKEGANVMTRMKQVLTGVAGMANNPALQGLTTPGAAQPAGTSPASQPQGKPGSAPPTRKGKAAAKENAEPPFAGNPLDQIVNIDFREMDLSNVVALLAQKAGINVIAGAELTGTVTANLKNVTLRKAMDTVLRMSGLGMVEEEGIFHIVPYEDAVAAKRVTVLVKLDNGNVADIKKTLDEVLKGGPADMSATLSVNETTNTLIIAGAESRVQELKRLAMELDTAKPVTPTVTEAFKLNNSSPKDLLELIKGMTTPKLGKVAIDESSRHVVVTDLPVMLEQVRTLIKQVDVPVKQVSIDSMIVDAVLDNDSQTGVDWIANSVRKINKRGKNVGSLTALTNQVDATGVTVSPATLTPIALTQRLTMGMLADGINLQAVVAAEVSDQKGKLLANPVIVTVENQKAMIDISQEIPYQESQQSTTGPPMVSTSFKDIGIQLEVTPKVTRDDHVIAKVHVKQSEQNGVFNNIPIEDKRETETTLRAKNGQTIFIGGLRRFLDNSQSKRVPILGNIPVISVLFRNNSITKESTELLVFLTCNVMPDELEDLPDELQKAHDQLETIPRQPDAGKPLAHTIVHPNEGEDPAWKWRRSK